MNDKVGVGGIEWKQYKAEDLDLEYAARFLNKKEADVLFKRLESELVYYSGELTKVKVFGKWHDIPRQQVAYGDPGLEYKFSGTTVPSAVWPEPLLEVRDKIERVLGIKYNFVLVNRYRDGKDHMGEHRDDEKELDQKSGIASVSLGQVRDFVLRHSDARGKKKRPIPPVKIPLGHGSLLLMKPPTNTHWYHSIPQRKSLPGVRINLTFRLIIQDKTNK